MPCLRLTVALVCCIGFVSVANARHRQIDFPQLIVCDQQGCREVRTATEARREVKTARRHTKAPITETVLYGGLVARARAYSGMTASQVGVRRTKWCAAFLRKLGVKGPVDDRAISFRNLPHVGPQVGSIAVYPHHVGVVTGFDGRYPIIISGNSNGRRVYEGLYPRTPIAYVMPD